MLMNKILKFAAIGAGIGAVAKIIMKNFGNTKYSSPYLEEHLNQVKPDPTKYEEPTHKK